MSYFSKLNRPKNLKVAAFWVSTVSLIASALWGVFTYITQENRPTYHVNTKNTYAPNTGIVNNSVTIDNSNTLVSNGGIAVRGNGNIIISTTNKNNN